MGENKYLDTYKQENCENDSNNIHIYSNLIARSEYETYDEMEKDQRLDSGGTSNSVFKSEKKYYIGTAPDVRDDSLGRFRDLGKPKDDEKYFSSVKLPGRFGGGRDFVTEIVQSDLYAVFCVVFVISVWIIKLYKGLLKEDNE